MTVLMAEYTHFAYTAVIIRDFGLHGVGAYKYSVIGFTHGEEETAMGIEGVGVIVTLPLSGINNYYCIDGAVSVVVVFAEIDIGVCCLHSLNDKLFGADIETSDC